MMRRRISILACSVLATAALAGCAGQEDSAPTPLPPSATLPSSAAPNSTAPTQEGSVSPAPAGSGEAVTDDTLVRESALRIAQTYMGYAAEAVRASRSEEAGQETELFAWLRQAPEAWAAAAADLAAEAALSGLSATVDGIAAESVTADGLSVADGLVIGVSDGSTTCVVEATFIDAGSVVSMAWAGPTCNTDLDSTDSASPSASPAAS